MSRHPEVKWAQRVDKVYITVLLPDAQNAKINLEPDGDFTFSATAGAENHLYELKLDLYGRVNVEESKLNTGVRSVFCVIEKAEKGWWNKLIRGDDKTPHYVKVDWDKWVDEDEDNGPPANLDTGGMDFSNFAGMGGMEGMPNLGGMGGMPNLGGMGGMPNFAGMGGMGDLEGMGNFAGMGGMGGLEGMGDYPMGDDANDDDDDDDDNEDQEVSKPKGQEAEKMEGEAPVGKVEAAPIT